MSQLFNDPTSGFSTEKENQNAGAKPPQCILELPVPNPERADLTDQQVVESKNAILNNKFIGLKFPRERKFRRDPVIPGQTYGIVSFVPSSGARPDKQGCFGVLKLRGNFGTPAEAERYSCMLMRKYDNFCDYDLVHVGQEFPLMTDNEIYCKETREVDVKAIVDDISLSYIRKKKEEEREQREEIEQRSKKMVSKNTSEDREEAVTDLEFYTTLRTKKAHCQHVIDETKRKAIEAQEALDKVIKEIAELDQQYPEYKNNYLENYNRALKAIGANENNNPLVEYMKKDVAALTGVVEEEEKKEPPKQE